MTVKQTEEEKMFLIFETPTHKFKIGEEVLNKVKDSKKWPLNLRKMIQKNVRQTVDESSGEFWEDSVNEIFHAMTKNNIKGE